MTNHMTASETLATCSRLHSYERNLKGCGVYTVKILQTALRITRDMRVPNFQREEEIMVENSKCA